MFTNPNVEGRGKRKTRDPKFTLPTSGSGIRQAQKSSKFLGVTLGYELKLQEHAKNVASKSRKVIKLIGKTRLCIQEYLLQSYEATLNFIYAANI